MEDRNDWQVIENSSPENWELGEVLRKLEGLHHDGSPLNWQESRQRRGDALAPLLTDCSKSLRLPSLLSGIILTIWLSGTAPVGFPHQGQGHRFPEPGGRLQIPR